MTINEIMMREIMDEEHKQSERAENAPGVDCDFPWMRFAVVLLVLAAVLCAVFFAGTWWQSHRELVIDREYNAWFEKTANEAVEKAKAMSNAELLRTERGCGQAESQKTENRKD